LRYLLITIALVIWLVPAPVRAEKITPLVFKIDPSLNEPKYVLSPHLSELQKIPSKPIVSKSKGIKTSGQYCSCVLYVKAKIGYTKSVGAARNWPTNSNTPSKGAVIVTYESRSGHVGIVSHFDDTYVYLESEANYSRCKITYGRKLPLNSPLIKGYYVQ